MMEPCRILEAWQTALGEAEKRYRALHGGGVPICEGDLSGDPKSAGVAWTSWEYASALSRASGQRKWCEARVRRSADAALQQSGRHAVSWTQVGGADDLG